LSAPAAEFLDEEGNNWIGGLELAKLFGRRETGGRPLLAA